MTPVRECRELEETYGTHYTDTVLRAEEEEGPHPREIREVIMRLDKEMRLCRCTQADKAPVVAGIAQIAGWERLWDAALDEGPRCIKKMKCLVKAACHRCFGDCCPCVHKEVTPDMTDSLASMNFQFLK